MIDVVNNALAFTAKKATSECEYMVLDFRHAFKQFVFKEFEHRYLGGGGVDGYFVYNVILVGIKFAQLLWC